MTITARTPGAELSTAGGLPAPGSQPKAIPHHLRTRMAALRVDISQLVHDTDKSTVLSGRWNGRQVVVKLLTSDEPYWQGKHAVEQQLYRNLEGCPPPVRVARLLHAETGITILEQLPGSRLASTRYPQQVPLEAIHRILDALDQLHAWRPPASVLGEPQPITREYLQRQAATGQLTPGDLEAIEYLLGLPQPPLRPEHGDAWATNLLLTTDGTVHLVDLEHTGWHVPGVDAALLYLLLGPGTPPVRDLITQRVLREQTQVPFTLNLMLLACREWGMHHAWGGQLWEQARPVLRGNLDHARTHLHAVAAEHGHPPS